MTTIPHQKPIESDAAMEAYWGLSASARIHPTWIRTTAYLVCGIYRLVDPRTEKVRYVGQTIDMVDRFKRHLWEAVNIHRTPVQKWIAKLLSMDLEPIMEIIVELAPEQLDDAEIKWVAYYREQGPLLNVLDGGGGDALRDYHKGRKQSPEWVEKRMASQRGRPRPASRQPKSAETREKMSVSAKARANTPEFKIRQAEILANKLATDPEFAAKWGTGSRRPKSGVMVFKPRDCDMCGAEFIPTSGGQKYCGEEACAALVYRATLDRANARARERRAPRRSDNQ